jgi:hypothetical protein
MYQVREVTGHEHVCWCIDVAYVYNFSVGLRNCSGSFLLLPFLREMNLVLKQKKILDTHNGLLHIEVFVFILLDWLAAFQRIIFIFWCPSLNMFLQMHGILNKYSDVRSYNFNDFDQKSIFVIFIHFFINTY